jgi:hypothetical protein
LNVFEAPAETRLTIDKMRALCVRALPRMYLPDKHLFCHCIRRGPRGDVPEGVSRRYTAITLLGLAVQQNDPSTQVIKDGDSSLVCRRLLSDVETVENLGDVALTLWAAKLLSHQDASRASARLEAMDPVRRPHPTVEIAWALTALSVGTGETSDRGLRDRIARRLLDAFKGKTGLFSHYPVGAAPSAWRGHVACFADWVYPVQALAHYHKATGDENAIDAATRSARAMCDRQGDGGQWWWHYDVRTGNVVEGYPVYSVHQDAMGPMALFDLQDAGGQCFNEAIVKSVAWMIRNPERGDSLLDREADLIWRKVCRKEPGKLCRGVQALASRVHSSLRVPGLGRLFPATQVDYECRPYHLGWLLYAFSDRRLGLSAGRD